MQNKIYISNSIIPKDTTLDKKYSQWGRQHIFTGLLLFKLHCHHDVAITTDSLTRAAHGIFFTCQRFSNDAVIVVEFVWSHILTVLSTMTDVMGSKGWLSQ